VRPIAERIDRLEFISMTGVAIAVAYWRRSPGRKRGRPGGTTAPCHGRLQTYCPAGAAASKSRASTNILPRSGSGIEVSGLLQTCCPAGAAPSY